MNEQTLLILFYYISIQILDQNIELEILNLSMIITIVMVFLFFKILLFLLTEWSQMNI
jgi:hypothetical protein